MFIKKLISMFIVNLVGCFAATIGMFAAITAWGNGGCDWFEKKIDKLFKLFK